MDTNKNKRGGAYTVWRTCTSKKSYSLKQADDFITDKMKEGLILYYYKCVFCNRYHLSKQDHTEYTTEIIGGKNE